MASSGPLLLTVDVGNSRLKACLHLPGQSGPLRAPSACFVGAGEDVALQLATWLEDRAVSAAALSSVAGSESYTTLAQTLAPHVSGRLSAPPDPGLMLDLEHPETVGHDRLFAAVGALARVGRGVIVVDAGTALTVDAVLANEAERGSLPRLAAGKSGVEGIFLGGAIAPGPKLLAQALAGGGAQLWAVDPRPGSAALGRSTGAALAAGIAVGFAGAAAELVGRLRRESGLEEAPLVLTGGAREFLLDVLPEALVVEHLVHEGLLRRLLAEGPA